MTRLPVADDFIATWRGTNGWEDMTTEHSPHSDHQATRDIAARDGLYMPDKEHDACGVGFVVDLKGRKSHKIVRHGLEILVNLTHRGAVGADPLAGDGAGLLVQIPHEFFKAESETLGFRLAGARSLWRWPYLHAAGRNLAAALRDNHRRGSRGGRPAGSRLAGCAGRQ